MDDKTVNGLSEKELARNRYRIGEPMFISSKIHNRLARRYINKFHTGDFAGMFIGACKVGEEIITKLVELKDDSGCEYNRSIYATTVSQALLPLFKENYTVKALIRVPRAFRGSDNLYRTWWLSGVNGYMLRDIDVPIITFSSRRITWEQHAPKGKSVYLIGKVLVIDKLPKKGGKNGKKKCKH